MMARCHCNDCRKASGAGHIAALLDEPERFEPQLCIYVARAPAWDKPAPGAVQFDELPPSQN